MQKYLWEAISKLPEISQEVVFLFYMRGYSQSEIAELLGISVPAVKNRLYDARKRLKKEIIKMLEETIENNPLKSNFSKETVEKARLRAIKAFRSRWTAKDGHNETIKRQDEYLEIQEHLKQNKVQKMKRSGALFRKGMTLLDPLNQAQEAIECFEYAIELAQEANFSSFNPSLEISCCLGLAIAYTMTGASEKGKEYLKRTHDVLPKHTVAKVEKKWEDGRLTHSVSNLLEMVDSTAMSPLDIRMILREELKRVEWLANWMLQMLKVDQELDRECMINVNQLIEDALTLLAPQLEKRGITVSKSLTPVHECCGNPLTFYNL